MRTAHALNTDAPPVAEHLAALSLRLTAYRAGEIDLDAVGAGEAVIVFAYNGFPVGERISTVTRFRYSA